MLSATVTFTFLGNYIFTAVVVVHLINKEAVRPNPPAVPGFRFFTNCPVLWPWAAGTEISGANC